MSGEKHMMMTEELEAILKKYPRGYHSVSSKEMDAVLNAYEYQMESPGGISGKFGVSRETIRMWGKKKIIHYFVRRDRLLRILEAYIPLYTFLDAALPNKELYQKTVDRIRGKLENLYERRRKYFEEQLRSEMAKKEDKDKA